MTRGTREEVKHILKTREPDPVPTGDLSTLRPIVQGIEKGLCAPRRACQRRELERARGSREKSSLFLNLTGGMYRYSLS